MASTGNPREETGPSTATATPQELIARVEGEDDYYKILGVDRTADAASLTKAYRKLALRLHPDKCSLPGCEEAFKKLSNAFQVLKDEDQRAHYDRVGVAGGEIGRGHRHPFAGGHGHFDADDLFRDIFRDHPGFQGRRAEGGAARAGGVHFSFNGAEGMQAMNFPEPFAVVLKFLAGLLPAPVMVLMVICSFMYLFASVVGFLLRNYFIVVGLTLGPRLPLLPSYKFYLWMLFFAAGLVGLL